MAKTTGIGSLGPVKKGPVILATGPQGAQITTGNTTSSSGYKPVISSAAGVGRTPSYATEIQQPDYTTTQYITNAVYQNLLGMNATKEEVDQMHQKFTEYAKTHPIFTRSTTYDSSTGMPVASRDISMQKNPLSENDFITNMIRQTADAKEYNAGTNLFDAMRTAMGSFRGGY
jgi:hypothetical protein